MAGRVCVEMFRLFVFTDILFVSAALNTHMQNVALDKLCNISSRHVNRENLLSGNCSAAINGNTNTVLNLSITPPNCIHTALNDSSPFWWVDLGQEVAISVITIYGRTNFTERMICVNVFLDGNVVKRFNDTSGWNNNQYDITVGRIAQVVNITRDCGTKEVMINFCEVQVWVCDDGWYGDNCTQVCGHCAGGSVCDKINGSCTSCDTGFQLPKCTECAEGRYGDNCTQTCGNCSNDSTCDKVNGSCGSCKPGYQLPLCKECSDGWYGADCSQTCRHCSNNSVCDNKTGSCLPYDTGFKPPLSKKNVALDKLCNISSRHVNREYLTSWNCSAAINGNTNTVLNLSITPPNCIHTALNDLSPFWWVDLGQKFAISVITIYGRTNFINRMICVNVSLDGKVVKRFSDESGWINNQYDISVGRRGRVVNITKDCNSDKFTINICEVQVWVCDDGWYGDNCTQPCGHCAADSVCDKINGSCTSCHTGFQLPMCTEPVESSQPNFRLTPVAAVVEIVSTVTVAAVVVMIVVVVVVVWLRRTRQLRMRKAELLKGKETNTENEYSVSGSLVNISQSRGLPEDMGASSLGSQNQKEDKTPVTARKSLAITETTVNKTIYENLELKSNVPIHSHDSQSAMSLTKPDKEDMDTANNVDEEEGIYNTEETYALYRSLGSSSIFDDLQKSLLDSLTSGKLEMEFAEFSKEMRHPHEAGRKTENLKKNRFKALCAYDHSRVVLRRPKGDRNTDYINASYIKGYLGEKAYIATQGPRSHTVDDLWWMVWQENVTQIIMLTSIKEDGKDKCEEYWPSAGTTTTYGHVSVTALKTDSRADFVVRYFVLESKQDGDQRTVSQYHYLVWPDHGVPSTYSLVSFWRYVKARAQGAIPVVHCSAGVGRTGTYIALDIASDLSSRGHDVNVKDIVRRLREDRTLMVQTAEQYKFLHEVILEEYTSRGTRMTFDQFDLVFPDNSRINKEFKVLTQMGQFVPKSAHTITESQ
ncbi:uncharacterized protein LOC112572666 isoform X2 [Pomacea canaliculata]|uniref:uncharacterized protein LOC112572666 isoform X2 n=1 Tax=Pomacea canaliculata TaxID=400727 RepID=UPI000D72D181|nr:uncharacterized protein LOC112572666 isoform X2 [Pomacea canaliculata]